MKSREQQLFNDNLIRNSPCKSWCCKPQNPNNCYSEHAHLLALTQAFYAFVPIILIDLPMGPFRSYFSLLDVVNDSSLYI